MNEITQYAPLILIVVVFLLQHKFFATPVEMEKMRKEIMDEVSEKYATNKEVDDIKEDISEIKKSLQMLCNKLLGE